MRERVERKQASESMRTCFEEAALLAIGPRHIAGHHANLVEDLYKGGERLQQCGKRTSATVTGM